MKILESLNNFNDINNGSIILSYSNILFTHYKTETNSLIKLGYIERISYDEYKKLKNIPDNLTFIQLKKLTKGIKLPILKNYTIWGGLILHLNKQQINIDIRINSHSIKNYSQLTQILQYLKILKIIGYVDSLKTHSINSCSGYINVKLIKPIPITLTSTIAYKVAYGFEYKRKRKIKNIISKINDR